MPTVRILVDLMIVPAKLDLLEMEKLVPVSEYRMLVSRQTKIPFMGLLRFVNMNSIIDFSFAVLADIDECVSGVHGCHSSASCTNTVGSYSCSCNHPYIGDGKTCIQAPSGNFTSWSCFSKPPKKKDLFSKKGSFPTINEDTKISYSYVTRLRRKYNSLTNKQLLIVSTTYLYKQNPCFLFNFCPVDF